MSYLSLLFKCGTLQSRIVVEKIELLLTDINISYIKMPVLLFELDKTRSNSFRFCVLPSGWIGILLSVIAAATWMPPARCPES